MEIDIPCSRSPSEGVASRWLLLDVKILCDMPLIEATAAPSRTTGSNEVSISLDVVALCVCVAKTENMAPGAEVGCLLQSAWDRLLCMQKTSARDMAEGSSVGFDTILVRWKYLPLDPLEDEPAAALPSALVHFNLTP